MRMSTRFKAFLLSLALGAAACLATGPGLVAVAESQESGAASVAKIEAVEQTEGQPQAPAKPSLSFEPVGTIEGFAATERLVLRQGPGESAAKVATVKTSPGESLEILDSTRDFLLVRLPGHVSPDDEEAAKSDGPYQGWAKWDAVIPYASAIILDAETGAVVGRVPLSQEHTAVRFSPDNSRAIFYRKTDDKAPVLAYEVNTRDYRLTRRIVSTDSRIVPPLFYSADGALSAFRKGSEDAASTLSLISLGEGDCVTAPTEISADVTSFFISPDGRTGFIYHGQEGSRTEAALDVFELSTMQVRQTIRLGGAQLSPPDGLISNRDGSELYLNRSEDAYLTVIDTWTGEKTREWPRGLPPNVWANITQDGLVGDSFLVKYWDENAQMDSEAHAGWITPAGLRSAPSELEGAVEAGGARFAVDMDGTKLFRLDADGRIRNRFRIDRPELQKQEDAAHGQATYGIAARPDGKQIIVFIGLQEDGC
jgi:hypothetical protein